MTSTLLTAEETAAVLRMSLGNVYKALRDGRLVGFQLGKKGSWRVKTTDDGLPRWRSESSKPR